MDPRKLPLLGTAEIFASGLRCLEGPAEDRRGNLWVTDMETFHIYKIDSAGHAVVMHTEAGVPNSCQWHPSGELYIAARDRPAITALDADGHERVIVGGPPLLGPNDLCFCFHGGVYFTDPHGSDENNPIGAVYYFDGERGLHQIDAGLAYPNGVCLAADDATLFVAVTCEQRIVRYHLGGHGRVRDKETYCALAGGVGPDGIKLDVEGNLYVAQYGTGCVLKIAAGGTLAGRIQTPGEQTTNLTFGGPDNRTMYITDMGTGCVYRWVSPVPGLRLYGQGGA